MYGYCEYWDDYVYLKRPIIGAGPYCWGGGESFHVTLFVYSLSTPPPPPPSGAAWETATKHTAIIVLGGLRLFETSEYLVNMQGKY